MKRILLCLSILLTFTIYARQIDESEAFAKATEFNKSSVLKGTKNSSANFKLAHIGQKGEEIYYYVFNKGNNNGYVIVSGDDRTKSICGYSDSGTFDYNNIPSNMKWWLSTYEAEIEALNNGLVTTDGTTTQSINQNPVAPLLGDIMWDQDAPYNNSCPYVSGTTTHAATGCVATAFSQVMMYYKYPLNGTGTYSYTYKGNTYSADFGSTNYNWSIMNPYYTSTSSVDSQNQVATLMYQVGVASQMQYGTESAAVTQYAMAGIVNHFGYDHGMQLMMRDYYPLATWITILENEINNSRPVVYGGQASDGGHQFIFDGYDSNNMFHVNWGWSGLNNGYFNVSILTPLTQGIGGSSGGFNSNQNAAIGVQPAITGSIDKGAMLYIDKFTATVSGTQLNLVMTNIANWGYENYTRNFGFALYNSQGQIVGSPTLYAVGGGFAPFTAVPSLNVTIGTSSLPNGVYTLKAVQTFDNTNFIPMGILLPNAYPVISVSGGVPTVVVPSAANLSLNNIVVDQAYVNTNWGVTFNVVNSGESEYYNYFNLKIYNSSNSVVYTGKTTTTEVPIGGTVNVKFSDRLTISAGSYKLAITDASGNQIGGVIPFSLNAAPAASKFTVNSMSFPDNNNVPMNDLRLTANITNSGGYFNDGIIGAVISSDGKSVVAQFGNDTFIFNNNDTHSITVSGVVALDPGAYYVALYSMNSATSSYTQISNGLQFQLKSSTTGVDNVKENSSEFVIYPNPVSDILNIVSSGNVGNVNIYNITGSLVKQADNTSNIDVSTLSSGNYIIRAIVNGEIKVKSFIKR